jgi:hypothetical protein
VPSCQKLSAFQILAKIARRVRETLYLSTGDSIPVRVKSPRARESKRGIIQPRGVLIRYHSISQSVDNFNYNVPTKPETP